MPPTPTKLQLKRDEKLTIHWSDGSESALSVAKLRRSCPCAKCKELREKLTKTRLTVLPAGGDGPPAVAEAKLVGNYALNVTWSDGHASGIYSFEYLRSLTGDTTTILTRPGDARADLPQTKGGE